MICTLIISIYATPTTTFKNPRALENQNDHQNVDEEVWDGHAPVFSALQIEFMLGNGVTAPKTGAIV